MAKNIRHGDRHRPGYSVNYVRNNYEQINIRVRKELGIREGLRIVTMRKKVSVSEYVSEAIMDRLALDGYIPGEEFNAEI